MNLYHIYDQLLFGPHPATGQLMQKNDRDFSRAEAVAELATAYGILADLIMAIVNLPPWPRKPPPEIAGVPYDQGLWKPIGFPKNKAGY